MAVRSFPWPGIDINPFDTPYIKGELIIPKLAMSYVDRDRVLPGMSSRAMSCSRRLPTSGGRWVATGTEGLIPLQPQRQLRQGGFAAVFVTAMPYVG